MEGVVRCVESSKEEMQHVAQNSCNDLRNKHKQAERHTQAIDAGPLRLHALHGSEAEEREALLHHLGGGLAQQKARDMDLLDLEATNNL
jgi:hypothetical protein